MKLITLYILASISMNQTDIANLRIYPDDNLIYSSEQNSTPKSTAIFWVDKKYRDESEPLKVRNVKAKVTISKEGSVKLISFVNTQNPGIEKYLRNCLKDFKVTQKMFDSGYIKPGEQYVHLRYMPDKVRQ